MPARAERVLKAAALELGALPPELSALAPAPEALAGLWGLLEGTLLRGRVPRTTKELIAVAATAAAGAAGLRDTFRGALLARGVDPSLLDDLVRDGDSPRLPARTRRMLSLGRRAALHPALITEPERKRLAGGELSEGELAELLATGAALAAVIALSRALGGAAAAP